MVGINVEVTYYGKEAKFNSKTRKVIQHHKKFTTKDYPKGNWKENLTKELRRILDKFEGISEVRFYVGKKIKEEPKVKEKNKKRMVK